jgi:hypothetical protein
MFIPWWGIIVFAVLYIYLILMDIRLHRRVKKLEHTVRKLEGLREEEKLRYEGGEDLT